MSNILRIQGLYKTFVEGKVKTPVLSGVDLEVAEGEVLAILGASGSGKTTFLQIIGGLQNFDQGEVAFLDELYSKKNDEEMTALREAHFGFVYQFHHLLPELSALENVMIPLMIRKVNKSAAYKQASTVLHEVGLSHRLSHKPSELSGGERQRVALARAIVKRPRILFADEPTGNLDHQSSESVMALILKLNKEFNVSVVFITHDANLAKKADRVVKMVDGVFI